MWTEENKVVQYKRMYASINVKVLGLAMNLAGGVGPILLRVVIKRCFEIAGGRVPACMGELDCCYFCWCLGAEDGFGCSG